MRDTGSKEKGNKRRTREAELGNPGERGRTGEGSWERGLEEKGRRLHEVAF